MLIAVGKREVAESTVAIRRLGVQQQTVAPLAGAIEQLRSEAESRGPAAAAA